MTDITNDPTSQRPGLIARLGFDIQQDRPKAMLWFEILGLAHVGYTLILSFSTFAHLSQQYGPSVYVGMLLPMLAMALLILFVSRRGSIIAYWIAAGLLIQPMVKVFRRMQEFSWDAFVSQPAEIWPAVAITVAAFLFLIQPQNRVWAKQRRSERKTRKAKV